MTEGLSAFLLSIGCGAAILAFWDALSGMRRSFARGVIINAVLDVAWWLLSISAFLWCMWHIELPRLRLFEGFGVIMGAGLYKITVSRYLKRLFVWFFCILQKIFQLILKILLTPMGFLYKIISVCIHQKLGKR